MSKVFKDTDVVIENYCLVMDSIINIDDPDSSLSTGAYVKDPKSCDDILFQAISDASKVVDNANQYAKKIILNANKKAQDEFERAQKKGYDNGFASGIKKAQDDTKSSIAELLDLIGSIEKGKSEILCKYENELKDLALNIAKKIIDTELCNSDSHFLSIYKNAVKQYTEQEWIKLIVSEFDAEFAMSNADLLLSMAKGAKDIKISVLKNAPRGTCIIETPISIVDASVETQIHKIEESFANVSLPISP